MGMLKWFNKEKYDGLPAVLGVIRQELKSLQPTDSFDIVWSKSANGMSAKLRNAQDRSNTEQSQDEHTYVPTGSTIFPENLKLKSSETLDGVTTNTYYAYVETPLERKELEFTLSTATPGTYCLAAVADNKMVDAGTDANVELKLLTAAVYDALDGYKIRMAMFEVTESKIELKELTALPVFHTYAPFLLNASESGE